MSDLAKMEGDGLLGLEIVLFVGDDSRIRNESCSGRMLILGKEMLVFVSL